jgi:YggT family protein
LKTASSNLTSKLQPDFRHQDSAIASETRKRGKSRGGSIRATKLPLFRKHDPNRPDNQWGLTRLLRAEASCRPCGGSVDVRRPPNQNGFRAMLELIRFINFLLDLYIFVLFAAAILSWLVVFNVVNTRNPAVAMIADFLYRVTEPVLRPIRERLPSFGGIDVSFIVLILIIYFIQWVVLTNLAKAFY